MVQRSTRVPGDKHSHACRYTWLRLELASADWLLRLHQIPVQLRPFAPLDSSENVTWHTWMNWEAEEPRVHSADTAVISIWTLQIWKKNPASACIHSYLVVCDTKARSLHHNPLFKAFGKVGLEGASSHLFCCLSLHFITEENGAKNYWGVLLKDPSGAWW